MGDLERYIVEEWAEDYEDGRLNRREFLRRVALMAGGTAVALPVLSQLGVTATLQEAAEASGGPPGPQPARQNTPPWRRYRPPWAAPRPSNSGPCSTPASPLCRACPACAGTASARWAFVLAAECPGGWPPATRASVRRFHSTDRTRR